MRGQTKWQEGSITVFLSLVLIIIMALLGTMVEVARGKVCRIQGRRVLKLAAESLMTEYSRPLFDNYHLFFLENGGKPFAKSIAEYAAGTLEPDAQLSGSLNFYGGTLQNVTVKDERYAGDDGGIAVQEQITSYMKRSMTADAIKKVMGKTDGVEQLDESAAEIEKKAKEEKEAVAECVNVLELMKLIDGVDCSDGRVKGQEYFVKMFFHGEKKPGNFGMSEAVVWDAVKENTLCVSECLKGVRKEAERRKFAKVVHKVEVKIREAQDIAKKMGSGLKKMKVSGDVNAILASDLAILERTSELLEQPVTEDVVSELEEIWGSYNTNGIVFDYAGINEKGGAESPMGAFSDALSGGVAKLILAKGVGTSKKTVKDPDHYRRLYAGGKTEKKEASDALSSFAENEEVDFQGTADGIAKMAVSDVMMYAYMKKFFSSVANETGMADKRLDYEWEYILCGEKSDKKNLDAVIGRLVLLRGIVNTAAILSSSQKRETAYTAALAVVGFTGMEPLIRFTQTLFIVLWGMVESLVDVAAILQGKHVPLLKAANDIVVKFPELYRVSNEYVLSKAAKLPKAGQQSFGYPEYLMLLMMGVGRDVRCYRMMDLMEWNTRDHGFSGFDFGKCVDAFQVTGHASYDTKFFEMPVIQKMTERQLFQFQQELTVSVSYAGR